MEQVADHLLAAARKVIAVHINYPSRAAQRGRTPAQPSYFLKPSSSLGLSGSAVERPAGCKLLRYADKGSNLRSKGGDCFTPVGPALIPADAVDPAGLSIRHRAQRRPGPGRHHRGPAVPVGPAGG